MPTHRERRHLPYSADDMFNLVADVEAYPEFIKWVTDLTVLSSETGADGRTVLDARMAVRVKMIAEAFSSRVVLDRKAGTIDVSYIDGPFRYLENKWTFRANADGSSTIDFFIDFEFASRALKLLIGALFHEAVRRLVAAFVARAEALHGPVTQQAGPAR